MSAQNYSNHVRRPTGYLVVALVLFATIIGAGVNLYQSIGDHQRLYSASLVLVLSLIVLMTLGFSRVFSLRAQDRAIRAEENLRHYVLTGKLLNPQLSVQQIVALRFAGDAEFPALAARAVAENLTPDAIKRSVQAWRADHYRV
jgi:hypothetical protein